LTTEEAAKLNGPEPNSNVTTDPESNDFTPLGASGGKVKYIELDAEKMESRFEPGTFDAVWISEALSHFPDKELFFRNAARVLKPGTGKLVIADWFKAEDYMNVQDGEGDIKLIEGTCMILMMLAERMC
jgi:tocopherol O-methyltransferase